MLVVRAGMRNAAQSDWPWLKYFSPIDKDTNRPNVFAVNLAYYISTLFSGIFE